MSRTFPGGANTDNLAATITAYDSGPWSAFAWTTFAGGSNARIFHVGTGTSGQIFYSSNGQYRSLEQLFATSQMLSNAGTGFGSGWEFTVITYDGSTGNPTDPTDIDCFTGDVSTSMVDTNNMGTGTAGSGARSTGFVDLVIGNRQNGLNRCWNGNLFCVGMVPYRLTLSEAESLRTGDMTVLLGHSAPIFLFGLEGTDLVSANQYNSGYGPSLTLTATGTSTTSDPITLTWSTGASADPWVDRVRDVAAVTHRRVDYRYYRSQPIAFHGPHYGESLEGNITPTGSLNAAGTVTQKFLTGSLTPTGALTVDFLTENHAIYGILQADFVWGVQDTQRPLRNEFAASRRLHIHPSYYYQRKYPTIFAGGATTNQGVDGAITPTGNLVKQTNKVLGAGVTPAAVLVNQTNKLLAGGVTPAGALTPEFVSGLQDTLARVRANYRAVTRAHLHSAFSYQRKATIGAIPTSYQQGVDGAITPTGNLVKQTNKVLTAGITPAGTDTNQTNKILGGAITPSGNLTAEFIAGNPYSAVTDRIRLIATRRVHLHVAFSYQRKELSLPGAVQTSQAVDGTITPTGTLVKQTNKVLTAGITPAGLITNQTNKLLSGGITPSGNLTADFIDGSGRSSPVLDVVRRVAVRRLHQHAAFSYQRRSTTGAIPTAFQQGVDGNITPVGALVKQTNKALTAGITPAGLIVNQTNKNLGGAITPTGSLAADFVWGMQDTQQKVRWNFKQVYRAHLHASFSYQRHPQIPGVNSYAQPLDGTITSTGSLVKQTNKMLDAAITPTGNLFADPVYQLNKGQDRREQQWQAALRKPHYAFRYQHESYIQLPQVYQVSLGGNISPVGDLTKQTQKALAAGIAPAGVVAKLVSKSFAGTCSSSGILGKQQGKYVVATITPVGLIRSMVAKSLVANLTPVGVPTKKVFKSFAGVITESGNLIAVLITGSGIIILDPLEGRLATDGRLQSKLAVCYLEGSLLRDGQLTSELSVQWLEGNLEKSGVISGH